MPTYNTLLILENVKECVHLPSNHVSGDSVGIRTRDPQLRRLSIQLSYGTQPLSLEEEVAIVLDVRLKV